MPTGLCTPAAADVHRRPAGPALATSPLFDPQRYAIRRLVDNRYDTLDTINVLQLEPRQRLQTKRGFPGPSTRSTGSRSTLSASVFPDADRDNFGESFAFLEYDFLWHIGDRTSVLVGRVVRPVRVRRRGTSTSGLHFNRPDGTTFYLGLPAHRPDQEPGA